MHRVLPTVLLTTLLALPSPAAESPWKEVRSPHFLVVTNGSDKAAQRLAWQFEQVRAVLGKLWPGAQLDDRKPFLVFAAKDEATLAALAPEFWERKGFRPVSVHVSEADRHFVALRLDVSEPGDVGTNPYFHAFRAYVGVCLAAALPPSTPFWLSRGLGEVHGNIVVRAREVDLGRPVTWHLERLRAETRYRPVDLVKVTRSSPEATDETLAHRFDASAWAFVHYLSFGDQGAHAGKLSRFVQLLAQGRPVEAAQQESLGDLAQYEQGFSRYASQSLFAYAKADLALQLEPATLAVRTLGAAESAGLRAGLHVALQRPVEARALVEEARRADPALPMSWEVEGRLLDREGRKEEALTAYLAAVERGSRSAQVHYRAAQLLWQPQPDRALQARMADLLQKAVELDPGHADAASYLAETRLALGDAEPALGLARKAVELDPQAAYHRTVLARVLLALKQPAEARAEAQHALSLADASEEREQARWVLDQLASQQGAPVAALRVGQQTAVTSLPDASKPSPVTVEVEFEVADTRGKPLALAKGEVQLRQDGQPEELTAFASDPKTGLHQVRYRPRSGKPGAVSLQLLRAGASPRGPGGGPLQLRVVQDLRDFEVPLVAALDAAGEPRPFPLATSVLQFEQAADGLHNTLVVELPMRGVKFDAGQAHVSLLARVRAADGSEVRRVALDSPIDPGSGVVQRIVWMTNLHLKPGRYSFDAAASDQRGQQIAVARQALVVPEPQLGLRLSTLSLLAPEGALASSDSGPDQPLKVGDGNVVPAVEAVYVAGSRVQLPFYLAVYRDRASSEAVELAFELRRGEEMVAQGPLKALPASPEVRYTNTVPLERLTPGDYELKLLASQGGSSTAAAASFRLLDADQFLKERGTR
jgi:tetratricopeptide (TPR) repeat protein